ncbi:MAG: GYD domain-containing protein [Chloroflexi bacterium]|nr:GYD domain-containing protein [Chloroflexota bacterium]
MATYVSLMKFTDQGIKSVKDAPKRIEEAAKGLEAIGGKLKDFYVVMGEYDYVAIAEGPSDEAALGFLLALGAQGNIRTTTLKAFTKEEFAAIVKQLP